MDTRQVCPTNLTSAAWRILGPDIPRSFRWTPGRLPAAKVVDAILYLMRTGCSWRLSPGDFPPWPDSYHYFCGTGERINAALREHVSRVANHPAWP